MRYPYERFLKFLVSRKVEIDPALARYGLPEVGMLWGPDCRTNIRESAPYAITRYLDSDEAVLTIKDGVLDWAEGEGFRCLWEIQDEFGGGPAGPELDTAFQIFVNPFARSVIGMMLLARVTPEEIAEIVQDRYDLGVDAPALQLYRTVFWDVTCMSRPSWKQFIGDLETKEERHFISMGLASPTSEEVRQLLGLDTTLDRSSILTKIMSKAYIQFNLAMEEPDPESKGAIKWAELAIKAGNALELGGRGARAADDAAMPTGEDFNGMFSVKIEKSKHISLTELQGPVAQLKEPPDPSKEE